MWAIALLGLLAQGNRAIVTGTCWRQHLLSALHGPGCPKIRRGMLQEGLVEAASLLQAAMESF